MNNLIFNTWDEIGEELTSHKIGVNYVNNIIRVQREFDVDFSTCFSKGQMVSKTWLCETIKRVLPPFCESRNVVVCGGWYGTLSAMLYSTVSEDLNITSIDIDEKCEKIANALNSEYWHKGKFKAEVKNIFHNNYNNVDVVINTSCEHIQNLDLWLNLIPKGTTLVLQSNNLRTVADHVSCIDNVSELVSKDVVSEIHFQGTLTLPLYKRFMVICTK